MLDRDLADEVKRGKFCFTYQEKNVAIIIPLKGACALSFFKGALLNDRNLLQRVGQAQGEGLGPRYKIDLCP